MREKPDACALVADFSPVFQRNNLIDLAEAFTEVSCALSYCESVSIRADFDIVDMPWDEDCLFEDIQFLLRAVEGAQTETIMDRLPYEINKEIVLPWLEQFGLMVKQTKTERG